jgi:hypothetical protein
MNIMNARAAADIAQKVRDKRVEIARIQAELCLCEIVMPCITESAEEGRNALYVTVPPRGDLYESRHLVLAMLKELGYAVELKNGKDISIKW